jgi:Domain of unknown function (DUF4136)
MKMTLKIATLFLLLLAIGSCQPFRSDNYDYDTVLTLQAPDTDFSSYATFALADDQGLIEIGGDIDITHLYDAQIFTRIRGNLLARGYTEIEDPTTADLVVVAGVTTTDYVVTECYDEWWDEWCWYWPCYPSGGWCYSSGGYASEYTVGTMVALMIDRASFDEVDESATVVWTFALGGNVLETTTIREVLINIDQAFVQSPYLSR